MIFILKKRTPPSAMPCRRHGIKPSLRSLCATFIALLMALAAASCHKPIGVLGEEEMVQFLIEAYQLEGFYAIESGHRYDRMSREIQADYEEIFSRHGLTPKKFERSMKYYLDRPERYEAIHQRVVDTLDARLALFGDDQEPVNINSKNSLPIEWQD
ncbi:MAG: DUF4296 domain-containing protein [Bacteroidales bacterium]|nr:DUF4296 domain-containing protein [Bacteroidales bacterium]